MKIKSCGTLLLLFSLLLPLHAAEDTNIFSLLRQREIYGHIDKKKIKNSIAALQDPALVVQLRKVDKPEHFVRSIPTECIPDPSSAVEDSTLLNIIPAALSSATQQFKDDILADTLQKFSPSERHRTKIVCLALLDAGAKPNVTINYYSRSNSTMEKHTALAHVLDIPVAEVMIKYGADVKGLSSQSRKTLLHVVAENATHSPALLKLYIDNGLDVNAKDADGATPLERLVIHQESHFLQFQHQQLHDKVSILLDNGGDYQRAMAVVVKTLQDLQEKNIRHQCALSKQYLKKYNIVHALLMGYEKYMQQLAHLQNIDLH